jgi:hypothetical protein
MLDARDAEFSLNKLVGLKLGRGAPYRGSSAARNGGRTKEQQEG